MVNLDILVAVKALQTQFEGQTMEYHHTLQQYMATVDSRLEDLRFQLPGCSSSSTVVSGHPAPSHHTPGVSTGGLDLSPILRSMKMEVLKFDGADPNGWAFCIENFFDFHGTPEALAYGLSHFT